MDAPVVDEFNQMPKLSRLVAQQAPPHGVDRYNIYDLLHAACLLSQIAILRERCVKILRDNTTVRSALSSVTTGIAYHRRCSAVKVLLMTLTGKEYVGLPAPAPRRLVYFTRLCSARARSPFI